MIEAKPIQFFIMQMFLVFAVIIAAALAAPAEEVTLTKFESEVLTDGYNFK